MPTLPDGDDPPAVAPARLLARLDRAPGLGGGRTHVACLALFFAASFSVYLTVLKVRGPAAAVCTETAWDAAFPFTPWWVWLYLLPYVAGPLLTAVLSRAAFVWYLRRAALVEAITFTIFLAYPTYVRRPLDNPASRPANEARLEDGLTAALYLRMIELDSPPANAAPSLHVSLSCLLAWALAYDRPRWWAAALGAAVVVWLSTLYTGQHHLVDVATGVLLASLAAVGGPPGARSASKGGPC
jgi:membrane-associated phospholipid phosphatase